MNELKIFENSEFGKVRIQLIESNPWFIAKDVCDVLKHTNNRVAISRLDEDEVSKVYITDNLGREQETTIISEMGLYSLILTSNIPMAKKFKKWVTSEVLPSIRKNGAYLTDSKIEEILSNPDTIIKLAMNLKEEKAKRLLLENKIEEDQGKVLFAESVEVSKDCILIGELAKLLRQKGIDIGQNRLFEKLRDLGYLGSKGEYRNIPTQKSADLEIFKIVKRQVLHSDGTPRIVTTTFVNGKGQVYFINKFLNAKGLISVGAVI